jgi:xanthine dehydrogenase iron-sulfur cluster and FAD-binding subunit A
MRSSCLAKSWILSVLIWVTTAASVACANVKVSIRIKEKLSSVMIAVSWMVEVQDELFTPRIGLVGICAQVKREIWLLLSRLV